MTENERVPEEALEPVPDMTPETAAEPEIPAAAAEAPAEDALAKAQAQAEEYLALAQRVQADFDNFRRRNAGVRADSYAEGQRSVATAMLEVLDALERAVPLAEADSALGQGIALTLRQMQSAYEKIGVTAIDRTGERFDPQLENAVLQAPADAGEPGTVAQVLQKGYRMGDHVLRHALVAVIPE